MNHLTKSRRKRELRALMEQADSLDLYADSGTRTETEGSNAGRKFVYVTIGYFEDELQDEEKLAPGIVAAREQRRLGLNTRNEVR